MFFALFFIGIQTLFSAPAYKLEELCSFPLGKGPEPGPHADVVFGPDGALYGTTQTGGSYSNGSVFRVTTDGQLTTLISFNWTNGAWPNATLLAGHDGFLYGLAGLGGPSGDGTAFRITTNGVLTTLAHFSGTNGSAPVAALIYGNDGALYGTTAEGGIGMDTTPGYGTLFRLTTNGVLTTLAYFNNDNGNQSYSSLVLTEDGTFYGATRNAHAPPGSFFGPGNVFRFTQDGGVTNLVSFSLTNSPSNPVGQLIRGPDGALYGTTRSTWIYRVTTNGELEKLAATAEIDSGGLDPWGGLTLGTDGAFYGTTRQSGDFGKGTVFRFAANGVLKTLVPFTGTNGAFPYCAMIQGNNGEFYGTTSSGGSLGGGSVFRLVVFSHIQSVEQIGETYRVHFTGVPGETYRMLRSTNLAGPWSTMTNITLGADGKGEYVDGNPAAGSAFYRTIVP